MISLDFLILQQQLNDMSKQVEEVKQQSNSRKKMEALFKEQEYVSKAFDIHNFYQNQRLNIRQLKIRLQNFKRKKVLQSPFNNLGEITKNKSHDSQKDKSTAKFVGKIHSLTHESSDTVMQIKKRLPFDKGNIFSQQSSHRKQHQSANTNAFRKPNPKNETFYKPNNFARYDSRTKTVYNPREELSSKQESYQDKDWQRKRCKTGQKPQQSKCSESSFQKCFEESNFQGKIRLCSQGEVSQLQNKIGSIWSHYQLVTKLLISLKEGAQREKQTIIKYISTVCSQQFGFLEQLLEQLLKKSNTRQEMALAKRLKKAVILSRLYENMAIVYLSMFISLNLKAQSNLTNLIGYSTSNLVFVIKLLVLLYRLQTQLKFSQQTERVIQTIAEYEKGSYCKRINLISQVVLRMQQNNEVIAIVNSKLSLHFDSSFQDVASDFLKNVELDIKPFLQYAHYIFQFLAFHLAEKGICGQFVAVQVAPAPYYPALPKPRTLVIQPWQVLFASKGNATFIRSHTQTFLKTVSRYWNIVYWTDLMPKNIDVLIKRLPYGLCLYRYHCKLERQSYVKMLDRIGCDTNNTVIIDRREENYKYHQQQGISLPWKGHRRDLKLLELLDLLQPLFLQKLSLRSVFPGVKSQISSASKGKGMKSNLNVDTELFQELLSDRISTTYR